MSKAKHSIAVSPAALGFLVAHYIVSLVESTALPTGSLAGSTIPSSLLSCMDHFWYTINTHVSFAPNKLGMLAFQHSPILCSHHYHSHILWLLISHTGISFHFPASKLQEIHIKLQGGQLKPLGIAEGTPTLPPWQPTPKKSSLKNSFSVSPLLTLLILLVNFRAAWLCPFKICL